MMTRERELLQQALDALDAITDDVDGTGLNTMPSFDKAIDAIAALREAMAAPQPDPVALESVHLTRDIKGMCTVCVNGRVAIQDNGDIIDHMATLEWFAQPAPVPLTDTETHAELWKLAVRKGLITVRSELIDPRNHGTRVSWMQGHDKACDISNDAAAHGIAASPEVPTTQGEKA